MFIVTGASSGIGRATAQALASRGCDVIAVARSYDRLRSLGDQYPHQVRVVAADISEESGIDAVLDAVVSVERIKGIVHAAGSSVPLEKYQGLSTDRGELAKHFSIHVSTPVALNNGLGSKLTGGRILYLDSYSATTLRVGWAGYSIVKAAAQMAARAAAAELKDSFVIRVFPGAVRTPLVDAVLTSIHESEVVNTFKRIDGEGKIEEASVVGAYVVNLLIDATEDQLASREFWVYDEPDDQIF